MTVAKAYGPGAGNGVPNPVGGRATFEEFLHRTAAEPVYVILGVQGSGTNLLRRLLSKTFGFSVLQDRSMVFREAARLGTAPAPAELTRAVRTVAARLLPSGFARKHKDAIRDPRPFIGIEPYLNSSAVRDGASLARIVYVYRAYTLGANLMAIKSDDIWEVISAIDDVLPNRRVILLTRDFRDNLLSVGGKGWGPVEPLCAARWVKHRFGYYHRGYLRSRSNAYHTRFETLVENPVEFLTDFGRHFGLKPTTPPEVVLANYEIKPNKVRKWERRLSSRDLSMCEAILQEELEAFDYSLASAAPRPPTASDWLSARTRDVTRRIPQKLRNLRARLEL